LALSFRKVRIRKNTTACVENKNCHNIL